MLVLRSLWLVSAAIAALVLVPAQQVAAQKFLKYGRVVCPGNAAVKTLDAAQMPIQQYQNVITRVPGKDIQWFCNGQPQRAFVCPLGTNVVQVDHRQPGPVLTITCLQR